MDDELRHDAIEAIDEYIYQREFFRAELSRYGADDDPTPLFLRAVSAPRGDGLAVALRVPEGVSIVETPPDVRALGEACLTYARTHVAGLTGTRLALAFTHAGEEPEDTGLLYGAAPWRPSGRADMLVMVTACIRDYLRRHDLGARLAREVVEARGWDDEGSPLETVSFEPQFAELADEGTIVVVYGLDAELRLPRDRELLEEAARECTDALLRRHPELERYTVRHSFA